MLLQYYTAIATSLREHGGNNTDNYQSPSQHRNTTEIIAFDRFVEF